MEGFIVLFLAWFYQNVPKNLFNIYTGTVANFYQFFSIPFLAKTLFQPWKRDIRSYINLTLTERFTILIENLIARLFGLVIRTFTIFVGFFSIAFITLAAIAIEIFWLLIPVFIALVFARGLILIF